MSSKNDYFMFFDNFVEEYCVWELEDQTNRHVRKCLQFPYAQITEEKKIEEIRRVKQRNPNRIAWESIENKRDTFEYNL